MKTKSKNFLLTFLVLIGLASCEKPLEILPFYGSLTFSPVANNPVSNTDSSKIVTDPFIADLTFGSFSDIDGNIYKTIKIGSQTWMAENLKTTRYNDGSQITNVRWLNGDISYKDIYGALYDHYIVNTGKLCPTGWHVPTDEEWKQLEITLGMTRASADTSYADFDVFGVGERGTDQGAQMKATVGWIPWGGKLVTGANTSGFSALPAGDNDGGTAGCCTTFWCFGDAWGRSLSSTDSKVGRAIYGENCGLSVRCMKD